MPVYVEDHEIYNGLTRTDKPVKVYVECPHQVIDHINIPVLASIADDLPGKTFTLVLRVEHMTETTATPSKRRRK